jgi:hypothetical protein
MDACVYEVLVGFEPTNNSFAESPLKPLGYSTISGRRGARTLAALTP